MLVSNSVIRQLKFTDLCRLPPKIRCGLKLARIAGKVG